ncbi:MAG TPA: hypothetical protein VKC53_00715 [Patescibacteria group bacterium]|nr:hypothetical protein [Patescibacteria group bacterium]
MALTETLLDLQQTFDLTPKEAIAVATVRSGQTTSINAHLKGQELKGLDAQVARVANTNLYRSALNKINQKNTEVESVDY